MKWTKSSPNALKGLVDWFKENNFLLIGCSANEVSTDAAHENSSRVNITPYYFGRLGQVKFVI